MTRFEAEALGIGHPWHGGEPVNSSFPDGPVTRVKAYLPGDYDFLYISLGTNDAGQQVTTAQTLANLAWMVERRLAAGGRADHLILTTLPPRTQGSGATIPAINDGIRARALAQGVHLIDLALHTSADNGVTWRSAQLHVGDGVHYAESVREWLAERVVTHMSQRVPD